MQPPRTAASRCQVVGRYANDSTIHGLKTLILARTKRSKLFWIIVLGACFGFTGHGVYRLVRSYMDNPTVTQMSNVDSGELEYPLIRFCPRNWVNESRVLKQLNMTYTALFFSLSMLADISMRNASSLVTNVTGAELELREWMNGANVSDFLDVYYLLADDPNTTIRCRECQEPPAKVITSQGICYDLFYQPKGSSRHDFNGYMFHNFTYRPPSDSWSQYFASLYATTYTTDLLYVGESKYDFFGFDPICLNANASYDILINPSIRRRISKPDLKHSGYVCLTDYEAKYTKRKTEKMCKSNCEETIYGNNCRGYNYLGYISGKRKPPHLPWFTSLNYTDRQTQVEQGCEKDYFDLFMECVKTCHSPCEQWVYETSLRQTTDNALKTGGVQVKFVYYFRLGEGIPLTEELSTRSAHTVLSDIGSQFSLWTGASALTVCQVVHFIGRWLWSPWALPQGHADDRRI